jgi:hypothetical protein
MGFVKVRGQLRGLFQPLDRSGEFTFGRVFESFLVGIARFAGDLGLKLLQIDCLGTVAAGRFHFNFEFQEYRETPTEQRIQSG